MTKKKSFYNLDPQIILAKQIVISGLSIETVENMALKAFSFSYADRSVQFPDSMTTFKSLTGDKQVCSLFLLSYTEDKMPFIKCLLTKCLLIKALYMEIL